MTVAVVVFPPVPNGAQAIVVPNSVTMRQFKAQLIAMNKMVAVSNTINSDIDDLTLLQWSNGLLVVVNDLVYTATQSALGYASGDGNMALLMQNATTQPY